MLIEIQIVPISVTLNAIPNKLNLKYSLPNCKNNLLIKNYIKHRKKYKKNSQTKKLLSYTIKQIPVYEIHYNRVHSNKYDSPSLKKLDNFYHLIPIKSCYYIG
jgi:hypothetical protein